MDYSFCQWFSGQLKRILLSGDNTMNYVRTSGGSMMPLIFKSSVLITNKKQTTKIKPIAKQKKKPLSGSK